MAKDPQRWRLIEWRLTNGARPSNVTRLSDCFLDEKRSGAGFGACADSTNLLNLARFINYSLEMGADGNWSPKPAKPGQVHFTA